MPLYTVSYSIGKQSKIVVDNESTVSLLTLIAGIERVDPDDIIINNIEEQ